MRAIARKIQWLGTGYNLFFRTLKFLSKNNLDYGLTRETSGWAHPNFLALVIGSPNDVRPPIQALPASRGILASSSIVSEIGLEFMFSCRSLSGPAISNLPDFRARVAFQLLYLRFQTRSTPRFNLCHSRDAHILHSSGLLRHSRVMLSKVRYPSPFRVYLTV
jgi:hypothetical protein